MKPNGPQKCRSIRTNIIYDKRNGNAKRKTKTSIIHGSIIHGRRKGKAQVFQIHAIAKQIKKARNLSTCICGEKGT